MDKTIYNTLFSPEVEGTLFTKEQIKEITDSISRKISDSFKKYNEKKQETETSTETPNGYNY